MSRQCYQPIELSTESFDLEEVDPIPQKEKFDLLKNGMPIFINYYQAVSRMYVDIKTADVFSSLFSKQDKMISPFSINPQHSSIPILPDIQELNDSIDSWGFELRDKKEIVYYLLEFPELLPILQQAPLIIQNYFKSSPLVLEVRKDPEEGSKNLMLYIQTSLSSEKAYKKLDEIDEQWWLIASKEIGGLLCLHVEFQ
ncbi:MAG: hypothetical protein HZR80_14775 [Candidatus Heimdallarchaeota archaeon]